MRIACIDIGTNSALALVAEKCGADWNILLDRAEIIRLGEGMNTGSVAKFLPAALDRMGACLASFMTDIKKLQPEKTYSFATAAARKATNRQELVDIFAKQGLELDIISGDKEAELTYWGANFQMNVDNYAVIDIGGGSTEILWQEGDKLVGQSLNIGAVVLKESFFPNEVCSEKEINQARNYIKVELNKLPSWRQENKLIAVAGTPTTLVACEKKLTEYNREAIHKTEISLDTINKWLLSFNVSMNEKIKITGLEPKRADIIFAGTLILSEALKHFRLNNITVSVGGLRYGGLIK